MAGGSRQPAVGGDGYARERLHGGCVYVRAGLDVGAHGWAVTRTRGDGYARERLAWRLAWQLYMGQLRDG